MSASSEPPTAGGTSSTTGPTSFVSSTRSRQLHQGPTPLLIPNAWHAGSARVIEGAGAQAIATTSAGLSWAHGHADDRLEG